MTLFLSDSEARSVAQGERVLWREVPEQPPTGHVFTGWVFDTTGDQSIIGMAAWHCGGASCQQGFYQRPPCTPGSHVDLKETWRVGAWKENIQSIAIDYKADLFPLRKWIKIVNGAWFDRLVAESRKDAHFSNCYRETDSSGNDIEYMWTPGKSPCRWHSPVTMPRAAVRWHTTVKSVEVVERDGKWWKITMEEQNDK